MTTTINDKAKKILDRYKRFVIHFNNDLEAYYKAEEADGGKRELRVINKDDIWDIQPNMVAVPFEVTDIKDGFCVSGNGYLINVRAEVHDGKIYLDGWDNGCDSLKDMLKTMRRNLIHSWGCYRAGLSLARWSRWHNWPWPPVEDLCCGCKKRMAV